MNEYVTAGMRDGAGERGRAVAAVMLPPVDVVASTRAALLGHFSAAFDLAERQQPRHACRVAHVALQLGERLGFDRSQQTRVLYLSLLHHAGPSATPLPELEDVKTLCARSASLDHARAAQWVAARFGLDAEVQRGVGALEERWDGSGGPYRLVGESIPVEARVVAGAHWALDIAEGPKHPLRARAELQRASLATVLPLVGPEVGRALIDAVRDDATWIRLWSDVLPEDLVGPLETGEEASARVTEETAAAMGDVVDACVREPGRARKVARLAVALARALGTSEGHQRALGVAGAVMDIGQLGVPKEIVEKPDILSVDEMEQMRQHPRHGWAALEAAPGFEEIARWVLWHHERPDGRGYPDMLSAEEIPLAPRILAVADSYCALLADRPYRGALRPRAALEVVQAAAGTQFDPRVVDVLPEALTRAERAGTRDGAIFV